MSKPPKAKPSRAEIVEAKVIREEDFALEAWRNRIPYPEMRRLALDALGYALYALMPTRPGGQTPGARIPGGRSQEHRR